MRKLFLSALATASIAGLALFVSALSTVPSAASVLQTSNDATGNQAYSSIGLEFEVNSPITVYALGIYDSGQNGIAGSLTADLMSLTGTIKASATFSGTYTLIGNYQFQSITPVTLSPGIIICRVMAGRVLIPSRTALILAAESAPRSSRVHR